MTLGEKIKQIRNTFGLSQEELAAKLNVSRQVITKWETDRGMPDIENLKNLATLFGISVDYLLDDEKQIEHPVLNKKIVMEEKNNFSNRYDYVVDYLKTNYENKGTIYGLTEVGRERPLIGKVINRITLDIPFITEWLSEPAIWFLVELEHKNLVIKANKENIETRELSSIVNTDKFTFDKVKLLKLKSKIS